VKTWASRDVVTSFVARALPPPLLAVLLHLAWLALGLTARERHAKETAGTTSLERKALRASNTDWRRHTNTNRFL
jgi:hypothetical protein